MGKAVGAVLGGVGLVALLFAATLTASITTLNPFTQSGPSTGGGPGSAAVISDIPTAYLALYSAAARGCPGLSWAVLAAIGKLESDHGRSRLPGVASGANSAGARGPMQFLPATFAAVTARHTIPAGGASPPSPYHPHDAVWAAAFYLCDSGARDGRDLPGAIFTYNHSRAYVQRVLHLADAYIDAANQQSRQATPPESTSRPAPGPVTEVAPGTQAGAAIRYARAQLGRPYVWGGNGETGFDCSGLVKAAFAAAGITLPRTADAQFHAGPRLPADQPLAPGDLVFYRDPATARITHVALYIGDNRVIHAPTQGQPVQIATLPRAGYAGATRPTPVHRKGGVQGRATRFGKRDVVDPLVARVTLAEHETGLLKAVDDAGDPTTAERELTAQLVVRQPTARGAPQPDEDLEGGQGHPCLPSQILVE